MNGLIVDNFAGGGGASTGIECALGRPIDVAINHDAEAVAMHEANHPDTKHFCQSIMAIDPRDACSVDGKVQKVRFAWFSPDCKHHSKAKGGKPREKNIRDLAWIVVHWAERLGDNAPDIIMLENVEEFRQWGPLDAEGKPVRERRGEEFDLWVRRLKRCGYKVEFRELRACDYGAPTTRKRLYLIARRDGQPIVWPEQTHGKPDCIGVKNGALKPWRTAAECIDWSLPCPSIFERLRPLKDTTLRRIAHGTMRYVVNAAQPFIVPVTNSGWNPNGSWASDEPLRTITTAKGGEYAAVDAGIIPLTHHGKVDRGQSIKDPLPTVTSANRGEMARIAATLVQAGYGERTGQAPRSLDIQSPLGTVVAGGAKHAAVATFLSQFRGSNTKGSGGDIAEPAKTVTAGGLHQAIVCAHMEQANGGPRNANLSGRAADTPVSTITATGSQQRLIETTLIEEGDLPPGLLEKATRTAAFLIKYYGNEGDGHNLERPLGTVTTRDRFAVVTVTIEATTYVIVDIGMRMLTPRELARAQGFPDSYILDPIGPKGRPLSKSAQIRMIGNSVCPDVAEALVRANGVNRAAQQEAA